MYGDGACVSVCVCVCVCVTTYKHTHPNDFVRRQISRQTVCVGVVCVYAKMGMQIPTKKD